MTKYSLAFVEMDNWQAAQMKVRLEEESPLKMTAMMIQLFHRPRLSHLLEI
jgi:hypothetical protein